MKRGGLFAVVALVGACRQPPRPASANRTDCTSCHAAITDEWKSSLHRAAFTDATYQASLALEEPKEHAFCNGCHAPANDCTSCHAAPHSKQESACASCHEFTFAARPDLVQKTFSEHEASAYAAVRCSDCHMPAKDGHLDHRFVSGHDPASFAHSIHVAVRREKDSVVVTIRADTGHAFPTGDMFRRARLLVFAEDMDGRIVGHAERIFGRTWGAAPNGDRKELADTRVRGAWSETIPLDPTSPITGVRWQLLYERVVAQRGEQVSLAASTTVAEGQDGLPSVMK